MSLHDYRLNPTLTGEAASLQSLPAFQLMMDVLRNEHPGYIVMDISCAEHERAIMQARCEGYTMALSNIESMPVFEKPKQEIPVEFAEDNEPPEQENQ